MQRRTFLEKAAIGGAAVALSACGGGRRGRAGGGPRRKVRWRLASSFPRSLEVIFGASEALARRVEAMSGGGFQIRVYPAGEMVPGLQVLDAVQQGTVQVGHTASYYYTGKHPAFAFETSIPFGLTSRQQTAWLTAGGGGEVLAPLYAEFGIKRFVGGNTGAQMGGWFREAIHGLSDLKGLKIRIPGLGGELMNRLGATVQVLAGGDIYPALERGAIDATEWIGPCDDEKLGFHKVAKHCYYPGFWEPGPGLVFMVNQSAWDGLPPEYQAIFEAATEAVSLQMQAQYDALNPPALQRLREAGVAFHAYPDEILVAARAALEQLLADNARADATYKRIYDHWRGFRADSFEWFGLAEQAYAAFAFGR